MIPLIGLALTALTAVVSLGATGAAWLGAARHDDRWAARGRRSAAIVAVGMALASLLLVAALLGDRFEVRYVAAHSARTLPLYLKVSALWAGQEGSLLLWAALQATMAAWLAARPEGTGRTGAWAVALLGIVTTVFAALVFLVANPFIPSSPPPADGVGLSPLLRHPAMVLHPPALYLGYVGLAAPAALALGALIAGEPDAFARAARPWALGSWLFLGLGLLLGARWAYDVLGWGGYWGWDPVENAGLMPWLTATGLVHALAAPDRRGGARAWAVALAVVSFLLVILGTYITRSGAIVSVHAFAQSAIGPPLLLFLATASVGALAVIVTRRGLLAAPGGAPADRDAENLLSRESLLSLTLVVCVTLAASVLVGTLLPTITGTLAGRRLEAGPTWFDRVTGPQWAGLVLLMGLCPLAGRLVGAARRPGVAWPALAGGLLLPAAAAAAGLGGFVTLAALFLIGASGGLTVAALGAAVPTGAGRTESRASGRWRGLIRRRRRLGGYLVHVGVLLIALGVVGTRQHADDLPLTLQRGETAVVRGYEFTLEDLGQRRDADREATQASVAVSEDGALRARLSPGLDRYPRTGEVVAIPAVRSTLREDLYLVLAGWSAGGAAASFRVIVNPLASMLWIGGLLLLLGGTVALWPAGVDPHGGER